MITTQSLKNHSFLKAMLTAFIFVFNTIHVHGQTLKSVAATKGKNIGNIMGNAFLNNYQTEAGNLNTLVKNEYNTLVAENAMKTDALIPNKPVDPFNLRVTDINTSNIDKFVTYAQTNSLRTRGHVLIWYNQLPRWLDSAAKTWTAEKVYQFSKSYITTVMTYCRGKMTEFDIINEAITDDATAAYRTAWYSIVNTQANNAGQIGYLNYFKSCYDWAKLADPSAQLYYNDYSIEAFGSSKNNFMRSMVKSLKTMGAPINGVGFQSHFTYAEMNDGFIANVGKTIDTLKSYGLDAAITELDIRRCNGDGSTDALHRDRFKKITNTVLSRSNCNSLIIWGLTDSNTNSWIPSFFAGCGNATLHTSTYVAKEAYNGVRDGLTLLPNSGTPTVTKNYTVRAKGVVGTETIDLRINGITVKTWTLTTTMATYSVAAAAGTVQVHYTNDDGLTRDVQIDYITVGSTTLQSELQSINTGMYFNGSCNNGGKGEMMHCNGYIEYAGSATASRTASNPSNTSISNVSATQQSRTNMVIYPSPATNGNFTIELTNEKAAISIYDINGRFVKNIPTNGSKVIQVASGLKAGMYILKVVEGNNKQVKTLVIQ